jgi:hypothetical protein
VEETLKLISDNLLPHWAFAAWLVVSMLIGQVMKTAVFPKDGYKTRKPLWLFWWGRKTLTLHPMIAGVLVGAIWRNPDPLVTNLPAGMAYFALAGALSVWAYELLKGIAKQRGIDLRLPGVDDSTSPPPAPPTGK